MIFFIVISNIFYFTGLINCLYLVNKNLLSFLIASEFMFLGLDLFFIGSSLLFNKPESIIFAVCILMLTVGESVIGLSLCIFSLKLKNSVSICQFSNFKY
jgi:NADH:ubiquinone oxidoreductase subunit K